MADKKVYSDLKVYFYDPINNLNRAPENFSEINDDLIKDRIKFAKSTLERRLRERLGSDYKEQFEQLRKEIEIYNKTFLLDSAEIIKYNEANQETIKNILNKIAEVDTTKNISSQNKTRQYASYTNKIIPNLIKLTEQEVNELERINGELINAVTQSPLGVFFTDKSTDKIKQISATQYKKVEQTINTIDKLCKTLKDRIGENKKRITDDELKGKLRNALNELEQNHDFKYRGRGAKGVNKDELITFGNMYYYLTGNLFTILGMAAECQLAEHFNALDNMTATVVGSDKVDQMNMLGLAMLTTSKVDLKVNNFNISAKTHGSQITEDGEKSSKTSIISTSYLTTSLQTFFVTSTPPGEQNDLKRYFLLNALHDGRSKDSTRKQLNQAVLYAYCVKALVGNNKDDIIDVYYDSHGGCHLITDFLTGYVNGTKKLRSTIDFADANVQKFNLLKSKYKEDGDYLKDNYQLKDIYDDLNRKYPILPNGQIYIKGDTLVER